MMRRTVLIFAEMLVLVTVLWGCATPKTINGHKVKRTLWVNGRIVYVLEDDQEEMRKANAEASAASEGVTFTPLAK